MNGNSLQGFSAYSLLVVNPKGQMREIFCPFRVQCIKTVDYLCAGTWVYVDKLAAAPKARPLYRINGRWYACGSFAIIIHF